MAHKKAAGSAKNLRDSNPKYRGVKLFGWQTATAGNIIIRQKWSKYESGENTYLGRDFTIHASIDGVVKFSKKNKKKFNGRKYLKTVVNIVPAGEEKTVELTKEAKVDKKESAKKPVVKKTPLKKPVAKKAPAKKPVAKKATIKKTDSKKDEK